MVDITLLELDMEGAEFNAPFSGKEGNVPSGSKVSKMLKRSKGSSSGSSTSSSKSSSKSPRSLLSGGEDDSDSGIDVDVTEGEESPTSAAPFLLLVGLVVMFAVLRRLRSRKSSGQQHELVEYES